MTIEDSVLDGHECDRHTFRISIIIDYTEKAVLLQTNSTNFSTLCIKITALDLFSKKLLQVILMV